jgi:hypothetical protein
VSEWAITLTRVAKRYGSREALRERLMGVPGVTAVQVYDQSLEEIFLSHVQ